MLWLILVRWIGSWDLLCVRHICRCYGLEACIYTRSFFTSLPIQNHSLHLFLGTFFSQKNTSLLRLYTLLKMLVGGSEVSWWSCPFSPLRMYGAQLFPKPQLQGWWVGVEHPRVVGGIARRGYMEWCVGSLPKKKNLPWFSAPPLQSFSQMLPL